MAIKRDTVGQLLEASNPMVPVIHRVMAVHRENTDTVTLTLKAPSSASAVSYAPGQFNMLYVFGIGEVPISVSATAEHSDTVQHTIRGVGPVSRRLESLQVGDQVGVRGPFGRGWPLEAARGKDVILVAGGIGLAPLRPVIQSILVQRLFYGDLRVYYGARSPRERIFLSDLDCWTTAKELSFEVCVDHAGVDWQGKVGVVTNQLAASTPQTRTTVAMLCGPEIMMHFALQRLLEMGLTPENIYLSIERNMKCAIGHCGHCQLGVDFVCKDGPVFSYAHLQNRFRVRQL